MIHIKTFEGLFKKKSKEVFKDDIKMALIDLEDIGFYVGIHGDINYNYPNPFHFRKPISITIFKSGNNDERPDRFNLNEEIENIIFTFIEWVKMQYNLNSKITIAYTFSPHEYIKLELNSIKDWNKRLHLYGNKKTFGKLSKDIYTIEIMIY